MVKTETQHKQLGAEERAQLMLACIVTALLFSRWSPRSIPSHSVFAQANVSQSFVEKMVAYVDKLALCVTIWVKQSLPFSPLALCDSPLDRAFPLIEPFPSSRFDPLKQAFCHWRFIAAIAMLNTAAKVTGAQVLPHLGRVPQGCI